MKKTIIRSTLALFLLMAALPVSASAEKINCAGPQEFVESMDKLAIGTIKEKSLNDTQKTEILAKFFREYVDIEWIGKFVLGRNWRSLEDNQQQEYLAAYQEYLIATYVPIFKDYNGEKMTVLSSTPLKREGEYLVNTQITSDGQPEIAVKYRIKKKGECFKVYDIVGEGVSMLNTQRQDFSSIYSRKGYEELMNILRSKSIK